MRLSIYHFWFHVKSKSQENAVIFTLCILQDVPIENSQKKMAVELNQNFLDPMLLKPNCVGEVVDILKNCLQLRSSNKVFKKFKKIYCLAKTFRLYQHRVKSAPFQFYSHLRLTIFYWNTLHNAYCGNYRIYVKWNQKWQIYNLKICHFN